MKKTFLLSVTILFMVLNVSAYDFQVGKLRYTILSQTAKTVEVLKSSDTISGEVVIPATVTYNNVDFTVTRIANDAFAYCFDIRSFTIPNTITHIGTYGFGWCWYLNTIILDNPNASFNAGSDAFDFDWRDFHNVKVINGNIKSMLEKGVGILGLLPLHQLYIEDKRITDFEVPEGTKTIKTFFRNCLSLKSISLLDSVESVEGNAFYHCDSLHTVTLSRSLKSMGQNAFGECASLRTIYSPSGKPASINVSTFPNGAYSFATVYIPRGALNAYKAATGWKNFANYVEFYAPEEITISVLSSDSVKGSVSGSGVYDMYSQTQISATSNYGYHFTRWSDGSTQNPRTITITEDKTYTATFAKNTYAITKIVSPQGWGTIVGSERAFYLDSVTLTASPSYGYRFIQWSDSLKDMSREFILTQDTTFTAEFAKNPRIVYNYDKTMGYITGDTTIANVSADTVTFSATANYGYHFVQWNDSITDNPRTIYLDKDTAFTAEFAPNYYSLRTETNYPERGTTQGDTIAPYLTSIQISATPNYGYYFDSWSDGNHYNPRSMYLRGDTTFTALFEKTEYAISITTDSTMGNVSGVSRAYYLDTINITAIPNHGYHFVQWSDSITDNPRMFVLTKDTAFRAEFAQTFEGQCGDSLYWAFGNDSLVFSGSGDMYTYTADKLPWALLINQTRNIEFAQEMTSISAYAFQNMGNLSKLNLSAKIFTIGDFAFENCSLLNYVTIPNSVISLGDSAFYGCSSIDTLIIGTGITVITDQFRGCTSLRYLQLGQGIESIDYGSFYDARQLTFIVSHPTLPPLAYPDEVGKERSFYNTNAQVLIPCDNFDAYQYDALWGSFNLKCLSSNSGTAVDGQVTVVAGDAEATFTWPTDGSADTYNLEITKDSTNFCSLIFDSEGRLLGIAFAPSANGQQPHVPMATMTTSGMSFQVTGLDYASQYRFSFETKDDKTQTLFAYTGGFHTNGTNGETPEGVEDINASAPAQKILLDGKIYILRGDKTYTLQGQEVK